MLYCSDCIYSVGYNMLYYTYTIYTICIYSVGYNINCMLLLIEYAHDVIVTVGATAVMGVHRCVYYKCAMLADGVNTP